MENSYLDPAVKKSLQRKEIFEELTNERMGEIQHLSKQINVNNLVYHFNDKFDPK